MDERCHRRGDAVECRQRRHGERAPRERDLSVVDTPKLRRQERADGDRQQQTDERQRPRPWHGGAHPILSRKRGRICSGPLPCLRGRVAWGCRIGFLTAWTSGRIRRRYLIDAATVATWPIASARAVRR